MHYSQMNTSQRAALLTGMRQSLGILLEDDGPLAAFAETAAFSDDLAATLMLSDALDSAISLSGLSAFNIDATALREFHGPKMVSQALRMAGCERVSNAFWRIGNAGKNDPTLVLENDLLARWVQHYQ